MLNLALTATSLMVVCSLLVAPQAIAGGRSLSSITAYPYPGKLPSPRLSPTNCNGVELCASAPIQFPPPIVRPGPQPPSDPCKGVEQCITAPGVATFP